MTQTQLADAVGVRPQSIWAYLHGGNASYRLAEKLAKATATEPALWAKGGWTVVERRRRAISKA